MRVLTVLTGTSPLVQHNIQLNDPDNHFTREIAALTSKRKKTDDDRVSIARLEFLGGLYVGRSGIHVPAANVRRCFERAGVVRRLGTAVNRAVIPVALELPLEHDGPSDPAALWDDPRYRYTTSVGIGRKRVIRTRPMFPAWTLQAEWELITDALDFDDFKAVVNAAGIVEGLGDNRVNGYGRFTAEIKEL
ncbi:MAG TPA: hypothetical protein VGJ36_05780 [Gemmatimonadales bacterium]